MSQTAYYRIVIETPFGHKQELVVKAEFPEQALLLTKIFDSRQIGRQSYDEVGVRSTIVQQPKRTTKRAIEGMQRHNDPRNEIWVRSIAA